MFFFIFGLAYINSTNFTPFEPLQIGVLYGAYYMFFAYGGFARVAVVAEEIKDAKKCSPSYNNLFSCISSYLFTGGNCSNRASRSSSSIKLKLTTY